MKTKRNLFLALSATVLALVFNSCASDDTADITIIEGDNGSQTVQGIEIPAATYTTDLVLDANTDYTINGPVIMAEGATLRIGEGAVIRSSASGANVYVAISQGAQIIANGTATNPIVFTSGSANPAAGQWGGLIVLGRAPLNSVTGNATATSEIGSLSYGGDNPTDNSGVIRYVRVEYSGGAADGSSENNGFSFYGVGSGTTVDFIQAFEGADDGIEFFGGTVNVNHLVITNCQDDSIDWTEGYTGTITDAYVAHGADHDKGIEGDGFNTDIGNLSDPIFWSRPTISNLTIKGLGSGTNNEAIRLRAGTQGILTNVLLEGFAEGFDLDGTAGANTSESSNPNQTGTGVIEGVLSATNVTFTDVTVQFKNDTGDTFATEDFLTGVGQGTGTNFASWGTGWTVGN